ncbi:hypothetical protein Bbelb_378660 [Branchiostoma belcheri]|nr:hypothetical protein Bbelb_378660 [Branchiostoma belcheri]
MSTKQVIGQNRDLATCNTHLVQPQSRQCGLRMAADGPAFRCQSIQCNFTEYSAKPYMCGECGYRTAHKSDLSKHIRTHTGEKPYKCDQCDFSAAGKSILDKHQAKHTGETDKTG